MVPFEIDNIRAYRLLLRIEIALRELIRRAYHAEFGEQWRRRIPGDLRRKIRDAESTESAKKQFSFRRLGPLYYLSFGELSTLLHQKTCRTALEPLGGTTFVAQVDNLSGPRNAISHARAVSSAGLAATEALYAQLESAFSQTGLASLLESPDVGLDPNDVRSRCADWLHRLQYELPLLKTPLDSMPDHKTTVNQYWWGDPALAGFDTTPLDTIGELVRAYNSLPLGVGSAAQRHHFLLQNDLNSQLQAAIRALAAS